MTGGVAIPSFYAHFHLICSSQVVEEDPNYWEAIASALSVGWLGTVVSISLLDGYQPSEVTFEFCCLLVISGFCLRSIHKSIVANFTGKTAALAWLLPV